MLSEVPSTERDARPADIEGKTPKEGPGNAASGTKFTGESGEEEGEGSEREEESVQDIVVVGEESADSEACVDVLSWWRWTWSAAAVEAGLLCGCAWLAYGLLSKLEPGKPIVLGSTTVTDS